MNRAWESFLPDLLPHLSGCPIPVVVHELRRAAQDFLEKTRAWVIWLPAISVAAGTDEIALLDGESECALVKVHEVRLDGRALMAATSQSLSENSSYWHEGSGTPKAFLFDSPGVLRLYPIPDEAAVLNVRASVKPGDMATSIQESIAAKYRDALVNGALARLMCYPNKAWTNLDLAAMCDSKFIKATEKANYAASISSGTSRIEAKHRWC